jgi:hypothetical protein
MASYLEDNRLLSWQIYAELLVIRVKVFMVFLSLIANFLTGHSKQILQLRFCTSFMIIFSLYSDFAVETALFNNLGLNRVVYQ